nr:uncharacterized protein LOC112705205 [Arachis hypogaea]
MKSTSAMVPSWLENLLSTRFFSLCNVHKKQSRNECKMFCLDCNNEAYCAHCIAYSHEKHRVVQIRRSSYHDVVRVKEIENALNITGIQTYRINGYQVFFLITRPINPNNKSVISDRVSVNKNNTNCVICTRNLVEPFVFCSLECKVWIYFAYSIHQFSFSYLICLVWTKTSEKESIPIEGVSRTMLSQSAQLPTTAVPTPSNANSRKRKGTPCRAAS